MHKKIDIPLVRINSAAGRALLERITRARTSRDREVERAVERILADIREKGDAALFRYTRRFDRQTVNAATVRVDGAYLKQQAAKTPAPLKATIHAAAARIRAYHDKQKVSAAFSLKTPEGRLGQIVRPLGRVGVYIPGGYTAYPSTVLMDVIPARIAGVPEIVAVTPPRDELDPLIAYVLNLLKVREVYRIGGAQAIGALAYGTASIRPVDKIVGPGNSYVALAKKQVYGAVDIDTIAGPSEVAVLADRSVDPAWVALDLLSQAEHGSGDETAVLVTEDRDFALAVRRSLHAEIARSPVRAVFSKLRPGAIVIFIGAGRNESIELVNRLAPEHLQIMTKTGKKDLRAIRNAAAVFLGPWTPVALGDYFVGTNHVLPTGAAARYASPLGVDSFIKRMSIAEISAAGLRRAAPHVSRFARAESFIHHALSVERRLVKETR